MVTAAVRFGNEPTAASPRRRAETMPTAYPPPRDDARPVIYAERNYVFRQR
jgi:hypothetical protein